MLSPPREQRRLIQRLGMKVMRQHGPCIEIAGRRDQFLLAERGDDPA